MVGGSGAPGCAAAGGAAAVSFPLGSKVVLQRWYEPWPLVKPRNEHTLPWTRCSLDDAGALETCRRYCASRGAARADVAMAGAFERWGEYAGALASGGAAAPLLLARAIDALERTLAAAPEYLMALWAFGSYS